MSSQNIFGNLHDTNKLIELYELMQIIKSQIPDRLTFKSQEIFYTQFEILHRYLMFNEVEQLTQSICKFNNHSYQESISLYVQLKRFEYLIEKPRNFTKLIENHEILLGDKNLNKNDQNQYKLLVCCLKLLSMQIKNEEDFKQYYKIHKQLIYYLDQDQHSNTLFLPNETSLFQIPYQQYALLHSTFLILQNSLKFKLFVEFAEKNYHYQTQLLPKILAHSSKASQFHTQIWKFQSILIDVTQNFVNFTELFSATSSSFKNEGVQKIAFTFNNISRGLKVLKIISEESIMKYFYEPIELKIEQQQPLIPDQNKEQFKPQIKIVFHGLDDINLDNPKQTKLDLDVIIQIGENEFFTMNNSQNTVLLWNYDKVKHFNLVQSLLGQLIECAQLWIQYVPNNPKDYFDFLCSKVNRLKLEVDRMSITNWFQSEKVNINNAVEALVGLLENLEFVLLKTESCLNKDLAKYSKETKPFTINKDKLSKVLIQSGFKVEYDILNKIEYRIIENMKTNLETILATLSPKTQQIKSLIQQVKKITPNFK